MVANPAATKPTVQAPWLTDRLHLDYFISPSALSQSEQDPQGDLYQGLTQQPKTIPARYFYDERGSQLFEQICDLPEYYLTRTETAIFQACADELAQITGPCEIVELGSGSSTKTRLLLDAYDRLNLQKQLRSLRYIPIDVSPSILELSATQLLQDYDHLQIQGLVSTYDRALAQLPESHSTNRLICFIGSSLGNFSPAGCDELLGQVSTALAPGEFFLLGVDLRKDAAILEAAYNDAQGITAAFNLNMLQHLNDRFEGNFDLDQFTHMAHYNQTDDQIEMHLRSLKVQTVNLQAIDLTIDFTANETILSEISRKFDPDILQVKLERQCLNVQQIWTDPQNWFGVFLCQKQ
ncbi:MAG: L-histidine N(alpha)-methyltransferase [Alkalinema sp. RL_2_19]|nr:L-histidine N(alpha)-methyltransferase [Alkalinema sp. RL_2_19]